MNRTSKATVHREQRPLVFPAAGVVIAAVICLPTAMAALARWWWLADLAASFRVQLFWLSVMAGLALLAFRRFRPAAAVLLAAAWNGWLIAPSYLPQQAPMSGNPATRLLCANVSLHNQDPERLLALIQEESPDIIVLAEATPRWVLAMAPIRREYAWRLETPRDDAFGMAVYSRLPLELQEAAFSSPAGRGRPPVSITGAYGKHGGEVHFVFLHPLPPVARRYAKARNQSLANAAGFLAQSSDEKILVGDLNITPWSPAFQDTLRAAGLQDSRRGRGVQATWPAGQPLLRIPIDHCLASPGITIRDRRIGPDIGSDHLPVIIDLELPSF